MKIHRLAFAALLLPIIYSPTLSAQERLTVLYPSPAGSWMIPVIAKEARYFERERLTLDYVPVGGSTRIVAALLGGSAQIIHAGHLLRVPRPTVKGIQQVIDSGTVGKVDVKAERLVDMSLVDELEKSGFIDSVYKE